MLSRSKTSQRSLRSRVNTRPNYKYGWCNRRNLAEIWIPKWAMRSILAERDFAWTWNTELVYLAATPPSPWEMYHVNITTRSDRNCVTPLLDIIKARAHVVNRGGKHLLYDVFSIKTKVLYPIIVEFCIKFIDSKIALEHVILFIKSF